MRRSCSTAGASGSTTGRVVPIRAGGRLTGRVGTLQLRASRASRPKASPPGRTATANFSVVRRQAGHPAAQQRRRALPRAARSRRAAPATQLRRTAWTARSGSSTTCPSTPTGRGPSTAAARGRRRQLPSAARLRRRSLRRAARAPVVGDDFNPEVGFVRRDDMRKSYGQLRFSPRPAQQQRYVRRCRGSASWTHVENGAGRVWRRGTLDGEFAVEFQNADRSQQSATTLYEFLPRAVPNRPRRDAAGRWLRLRHDPRAGSCSAMQRKVSGHSPCRARHVLRRPPHGISSSSARGRRSTSHLSVEPTYSINRVEPAARVVHRPSWPGRASPTP